MKGVVFTELFSFVEEKHCPVFLQLLIDESDLASEGVYTATGTYPACEMARLVKTMADKTGTDVSSLLRIFGEHLFSRFHAGFPEMFDGMDNATDFLASVEDHIHIEVRKLYPDAELPSIEVTERRPDGFTLIYTSSRHLGDFCEGLIIGCLKHFRESATIKKAVIETEPNSVIAFRIEKRQS